MSIQKDDKKESVERIYDIEMMVIKLIETFGKNFNHYPKKILFLRDGVSDGQFQMVFKIFNLNSSYLIC